MRMDGKIMNLDLQRLYMSKLVFEAISYIILK